MKMSIEHWWNDKGGGNRSTGTKYCPTSIFPHQVSHMDLSGIETRFPHQVSHMDLSGIETRFPR